MAVPEAPVSAKFDFCDDLNSLVFDSPLNLFFRFLCVEVGHRFRDHSRF